jgi:hypothetical protein
MEETETTEMDKGQRKSRWTKKRETGKEAQMGTQERRYESEGRSKSTILERSVIK